MISINEKNKQKKKEVFMKKQTTGKINGSGWKIYKQNKKGNINGRRKIQS